MALTESSKADRILDTAAELFACKAFHEVRLDDIAARAQVGKGTVYLYWDSKEAIYLAVIRRGFAMVDARIANDLPRCETTWERLDAIVGAIVEFAFAYPGMYQVMRSGQITPEDPELQRTRRCVSDRIERAIRDGETVGDLDDPQPALTAQYVFSSVRGVMLYPPEGLTSALLKSHMMRVLHRGIAAPERAR